NQNKEDMQSKRIEFRNVVFRCQALQANVTGSVNVGVGTHALMNNSTGYNVAVGNFALENNTTGIHNTAVGNFGLAANGTGAENKIGRASCRERGKIGLDNVAVD